MDIFIDAHTAGLTVKELLRKNGISRGLVTSLKKREDGITVNGEHATVRLVLREGDVLRLADEDRPEDENELLIPTKMPLDIIYEDEDMIAVNKPYGIPTHPSLGHFEDTLANGLAYYFSTKGLPFVFRAVNRLDRDTSGAVLIARSRLSAARLTALMQTGKIQKTYIAVLNGRIYPEDGTVNAAIRRCENSIMLRQICDESENGAKSALTVYKTLLSSEDASVIEAQPVTGRTHQLRVHFAHMGCPIVGDGFYGSAESAPTQYDRLIARQALHAAGLCIDYGDRTLNITASLPHDIEALIRAVKEKN